MVRRCSPHVFLHGARVDPLRLGAASCSKLVPLAPPHWPCPRRREFLASLRSDTRQRQPRSRMPMLFRYPRHTETFPSSSGRSPTFSTSRPGMQKSVTLSSSAVRSTGPLSRRICSRYQSRCALHGSQFIPRNRRGERFNRLTWQSRRPRRIGQLPCWNADTKTDMWCAPRGQPRGEGNAPAPRVCLE